jgi:citrate synthase
VDARWRRGLEGVIVAETALSFPDSKKRRLIVRGRDMREINTSAGFEEACDFLWRDIVPGGMRADALGGARARIFGHVSGTLQILGPLAPIDAVRTVVSSVPDEKTLPAEPSAVVAAIGIASAASLRLSRGEEPVPPDPHLSHAQDILRMIEGTPPTPEAARALDLYITTMMEHGLNASTFAARVVASTGAGIVSSVTAALAALRGPLHGGAPSLVLDMLDEIGTPGRAVDFVRGRMARGEKIFGFGSRGYEGRDPRADIFRDALLALFGRTARLDLAEAVEAAIGDEFKRVKPGRRVETNVEYYGSLLLEAAGVPRPGFTPLFAVSRCAGWIAHIREEEKGGRLMRPAARYVGAMPPE